MEYTIVKLYKDINIKDITFAENENNKVCRNSKLKEAPNRLLDITALKMVVEPDLRKFLKCNKNDRRLCDGIIRGFEMEMVIKCMNCDSSDREAWGKIKKLSYCLTLLDIHTTGNLIMKRVFQKKIYYLTKGLHSGSPPDLDIKKVWMLI